MRLTYNARQELSMNSKLVALALLGIAIAQTSDVDNNWLISLSM